MRSVRVESGASRGAGRSRRPFAERPTRLGLRRGLLGEATWPSARKPREVRRAHDDGHAIAPRVERDVFALQQELVDEHGEAEEIAEGRHGAGHAARQLEQGGGSGGRGGGGGGGGGGDGVGWSRAGGKWCRRVMVTV